MNLKTYQYNNISDMEMPTVQQNIDNKPTSQMTDEEKTILINKLREEIKENEKKIKQLKEEKEFEDFKKRVKENQDKHKIIEKMTDDELLMNYENIKLISDFKFKLENLKINNDKTYETIDASMIKMNDIIKIKWDTVAIVSKITEKMIFYKIIYNSKYTHIKQYKDYGGLFGNDGHLRICNYYYNNIDEIKNYDDKYDFGDETRMKKKNSIERIIRSFVKCDLM